MTKAHPAFDIAIWAHVVIPDMPVTTGHLTIYGGSGFTIAQWPQSPSDLTRKPDA